MPYFCFVLFLPQCFYFSYHSPTSVEDVFPSRPPPQSKTFWSFLKSASYSNIRESDVQKYHPKETKRRAEKYKDIKLEFKNKIEISNTLNESKWRFILTVSPDSTQSHCYSVGFIFKRCKVQIKSASVNFSTQNPLLRDEILKWQ